MDANKLVFAGVIDRLTLNVDEKIAQNFETYTDIIIYKVGALIWSTIITLMILYMFFKNDTKVDNPITYQPKLLTYR